jgi:branched-chain amino acid transport system permease protein
MTRPTADTPAQSAPDGASLLARHATAASPPAVRRGSTLVRNLGLTLLVVGVILLSTYRLQVYYDYLEATAAAYLCAVAGLTVLTGLNGQVSLGHSALMAVGAYTVAMMQSAFFDHNVLSQWTLLYSLAGAVLTTSVIGLVVGLAAARLRGPYLAGLTLAIVVVVPSIASQFPKLFHGDQGLQVPILPAPAALGDAFPNEQWQAWFATICAGVVMFFLANVVRSRYGRQLRAVRDNEVAAQLSGVHVARTQVVTFVVSAACAGLGGGALAAINQAVTPDGFSLQLSLNLLLAIVLGGLGSLAGAVWGSVAIAYLPYLASKAIPDSASNLKGNLPLAIYGLALVVIAILAPGGLQGLLRRVGRAVRPRHTGGDAQAPPQPLKSPADL